MSDGRIVQRRNRPTKSCARCRKQKTRCNRETPCSSCVKSRHATTCDYANLILQRPPDEFHYNNGQTTPVDRIAGISRVSKVSRCPPCSLQADSSTASISTSQQSARDVEALKSQIRHLEKQLSIANHASVQPQPDVVTVTSTIGGTFHIHHESRFTSISHKTRFFGQSHFCNAALLVRMPHVEIYYETKSLISIVPRYLRGHGPTRNCANFAWHTKMQDAGKADQITSSTSVAFAAHSRTTFQGCG